MEKDNERQSGQTVCGQDRRDGPRNFREGQCGGRGISARHGADYSSAAEGIRDFNLRLIEMTQTNTMAALDFARRGSNLLPERCQLPGLLGHRLELLAGVR